MFIFCKNKSENFAVEEKKTKNLTKLTFDVFSKPVLFFFDLLSFY